MRKVKILTVGSLVMDLTVAMEKFPSAGSTVMGSGFNTAAGGKGANQAVQAARLGADVTMVGKVGKDDFGKRMIETVAAAGVSTEHIVFSDTSSTAVGNVQIEHNNEKTENRICVVPGANMDIRTEDIAFLQKEITRYDMVMLQLEIPMEINVAVAKMCKENDVPVMLNTAPYAPLPEELWGYVSFVSPNEHEASALTGINVIDRDSAEKAVQAMLEKGVDNVIITMGSKGAMYGNSKGYTFYEAVKGVKAMDPTAAGDSFVAAFCTSYCKGMGVDAAMKFACRTAAITVSRMGAMPSLPTLYEVEGNTKTEAAVETFLNTAAVEVSAFIANIDRAPYYAAADIIRSSVASGGRLHITGIGKPAHIAGYAASLIASTGTPTYYLHGTEAVHGSCGQLCEGDVVICISNSGETDELKSTAIAVRNNGASVIAITGNADSWLGKFADVHLFAGVTAEGGPLNRAPRCSVLTETLALQVLSVILQQERNITPAEYVLRHPGGSLGKLRKGEKD